jgi:hypothetical protein
MSNHIALTIAYATYDDLLGLNAMRWRPDIDQHHPAREDRASDDPTPEDPR